MDRHHITLMREGNPFRFLGLGIGELGENPRFNRISCTAEGSKLLLLAAFHFCRIIKRMV